ncbi:MULTISPECIES: MarC family protein [unclassified Devosia]|uniref:MarC family protein n=1 Tax=unclassified Devosia TaxID=196773 RepID=UPI000FD9E667|nr:MULTISPECIES: MarC family protein [unclassified Devosia]
MPVDTYLLAVTTFFATIGPADLAVVFLALTRDTSSPERRRLALRGVLIGGLILLFFALFGEPLLALFGITLPALRTAGGVLLLLIAIDMVFARSSGGTSTTTEEDIEARDRADISVFPLATPLIAGPGAISAVILLIAGSEGDYVKDAAVIAGLLTILLLTYVMLRLAIPIQRLLGVTGAHVVSRVVGVLLSALAVQFIFDGIASSGIFRPLAS